MVTRKKNSPDSGTKYVVRKVDERGGDTILDAAKFDGMFRKLLKSGPIPQASVNVEKTKKHKARG
jgi:hypothetical protein